MKSSNKKNKKIEWLESQGDVTDNAHHHRKHKQANIFQHLNNKRKKKRKRPQKKEKKKAKL